MTPQIIHVLLYLKTPNLFRMQDVSKRKINFRAANRAIRQNERSIYHNETFVLIKARLMDILLNRRTPFILL